MGDEDEDQPENNKVWTDYFLKPLESTSKVIFTDLKSFFAAKSIALQCIHHTPLN